MRGQEARSSISSEDCTYFVPAHSRVLVNGEAKRWNVWSGAYLDANDFEREDFLLMQDHKGGYWWAFFEDIFKQDRKMRLHPCSLSHKEVDWIVTKRVLLIADSDLRLSDFSNLCKTEKPPTIDETLETIDLAARHLATTREVTIFRIGPDGKKTPDEVKTADYGRAKADIKRNPADTRNMRRFCNRQGWNGEGPSNLDRICHGYARPSWSPLTSRDPSRGPSRRPSCCDSSSTLDEPEIEEIPNPISRHKHSTAYHIMKLAGVPKAVLQTEQYKYDLKHARREKKPKGYVRPCRWMVVKRIRGFWRGKQRKMSRDASPSNEKLSSEKPENEKAQTTHTENKRYPSSNPPDYSSRNGSYQCSTSASLVYSEDISPLIRTAPELGAVTAAQWVEKIETSPAADVIDDASCAVKADDWVKTYPDAEIIHVVKREVLPFRPRHDSVEGGIAGECESKATFADPGLSATVAREDVKRLWVGDGEWKWIFNEGFG